MVHRYKATVGEIDFHDRILCPDGVDLLNYWQDSAFVPDILYPASAVRPIVQQLVQTVHPSSFLHPFVFTVDENFLRHLGQGYKWSALFSVF